MEKSRMQTRLMSKSNSTTVDNVTQRFERVSTDEDIDSSHEDEGTSCSSSKKHRLSSAGIDNSSSTSKKLRQKQVSREQVTKTTRAVIEKLLHWKEPKSTPKNRQSRKSERKHRSNKSPIACTFSEAGENSDMLLSSKVSKTEDIFLKNEELPSLDFSGSFEADSCSLPTDIEADGCEPDHSTKDKLDTTQESTHGQVNEKVIIDVAAGLRKIGDDVDDKVKQEIWKAAIEIVKKKAYKTYKEAMQSLLDISHQQPTDQLCESERYQVALVWLLTEKTIAEAKKAMASNSEVNGVVENAANFISENFPSWLNPWM